jgi:uncharacterized protein (DUF983 family)
LKLKGILLGRCPRCGRGAIFRPGLAGLFLMNERCPVCGMVYERGPGYFLGAMYVSYGLGVLTILPVAMALAVVLDWPLWAVMTFALIQTLVSVPLFLRLSRSIWIYVDRMIDPND